MPYVYIKITKNSKRQAYYHIVDSYRHNGKVKHRILMSIDKFDDKRILINGVKRVKFDISDTYKNEEKENFGKGRYKKECGESYEGTEHEGSTKDFKD